MRIYKYIVFSFTLILSLSGCSSTQLGAVSSGLKAINNSMTKPGGIAEKSCKAREDDPDSPYLYCFYDDIGGSCSCTRKNTLKEEKIF